MSGLVVVVVRVLRLGHNRSLAAGRPDASLDGRGLLLPHLADLAIQQMQQPLLTVPFRMHL